VIKKAPSFLQPSAFRIDLRFNPDWFNARVFSHYDFVMCVDACGMRHRGEATRQEQMAQAPPTPKTAFAECEARYPAGTLA
jgi:hypothetical protein